MASIFVDDQALVGLLAESIETDLSVGDRLTDLLSRSVPWQFPGRLLEVLTAHVSSVSDVQLRHGVLAVEYSALHQYLHAIALADDSLIEPSSSSAYASNTVAAILDGDLLQARAFSHLDGVVEEAPALAEAHRHLSAASVSIYERTTTTSVSSTGIRSERDASSLDRSPRALELAPLAGIAGTLAGRMRSLPDSQVRSLAGAAVELGTAVPIRAPTGWQPPATAQVGSAFETLAPLVGASTVADIEGLVETERSVASGPPTRR